MLRVLAPWFLVIGVASVGLLLCFSQKRTLRMPRAFLAFAAAGSVTLFAVCLLCPTSYGILYWAYDFAGNALLCLLAAEIIWALLPRHLVLLWIGMAVVLVVLSVMIYVIRLPQTLGTPLVIISRGAAFIGGILLFPLLLASPNWTIEHRMATAGVFAVLAGELLSFLGGFFHTRLSQTLAMQLATLLGLILLSMAVCSKQTAPSAS
jgi:hypothetical protein